MTDLCEFLILKIEELVFYKVSPDEALVTTNLLDSIALVDLAVAIQNETKIKIPFQEINRENFNTVINIIEYLNSKLKAI
ncbi:MAG: phosphopantetheine-binding protein [Bacteroidetes bacterium]|nr:phosphopantetheine-binding protein [Bacteroidota bacterium]